MFCTAATAALSLSTSYLSEESEHADYHPVPHPLIITASKPPEKKKHLSRSRSCRCSKVCKLHWSEERFCSWSRCITPWLWLAWRNVCLKETPQPAKVSSCTCLESWGTTRKRPLTSLSLLRSSDIFGTCRNTWWEWHFSTNMCPSKSNKEWRPSFRYQRWLCSIDKWPYSWAKLARVPSIVSSRISLLPSLPCW